MSNLQGIGAHNTNSLSIAQTLHHELIEFEKHITKLMDQQEPVINQISEKVKKIVSDISSDLETEIYGSFATKLSMPWSDIDFIVTAKGGKDIFAENYLAQIDQKFREMSSVFADVKYIPNATVPIIKAICTPAYGGKKLDIAIQDGKHTGPRCVELVAKYLDLYQCLRYLVLPFKQLIYNSQMNDPYQGGLTSYALVLMIVSFLQMKLYNKLTIEAAFPNLGVLFIEFLNWYSNLEYMTTEIRPLRPIMEVGLAPFAMVAPEVPNNSIVVVDPLNSSNNVARATYKFHFLKVEFFNRDRTFSL